LEFGSRPSSGRSRLLLDAQRDDGIFAAVFVDLDAFKSFNDTVGHAAGDRIVQTAGAQPA
jgi:diguanylate cyclase (GGDEF)-like protein